MPHVTFIHGIANKPAQDKLHDIWKHSLERNNGIDLGAEGVTSSMVYWADVFYAEPASDEGAYESVDQLGSAETLVSRKDQESDHTWREQLPAREKSLVDGISSRMNLDAMVDEEVAPPKERIGIEYERIPLPGWLKHKLMADYLRDVHHYLFNVEFTPRPGSHYRTRDENRGRMISALKAGAAQSPPHIVVSHSMGTVISYDCLKRVPDCPAVDGLITIGSPLGLDEIQDELKPDWTRMDGFPRTRLTGPWINIYDRLDPVAGLDPNLSNDYRWNNIEMVEDIYEPNWGPWRHDISKYLQGAKLREKLAEMLKL